MSRKRSNTTKAKRTGTIASAASISLLASYGVAAAGPVNAAPAAAGDQASSQPPGVVCTPLPEVSRSYLGPNGEQSDTPVAGYATLVHFAGGSQQIQVPTGFDPITASDATLFYYGFPARPKDPVAEAQWESDFRNYKGSAPAAAASCNVRNTFNGTLNIWGGVLKHGSGITGVDGYFTQPTPLHFCSANDSQDSHSWWTGIGEFNALLQSGVASSEGPPGNLVAWWEAENGLTNLGTGQENFSGLVIHAGDVIRPTTSYKAGPPNEVTMSVFDTTTGLSASSGALQLIADSNGTLHSPSYFYDGSTADWIDERQSVSGIPTQLRAQSPLDTTWGYLGANGSAPGTGNDVELVTMTDKSTILAIPHNYTGAAFANKFNACHG
jgi:hypothetical protein